MSTSYQKQEILLKKSSTEGMKSDRGQGCHFNEVPSATFEEAKEPGVQY